jgi:hypothetical protein
MRSRAAPTYLLRGSTGAGPAPLRSFIFHPPLEVTYWAPVLRATGNALVEGNVPPTTLQSWLAFWLDFIGYASSRVPGAEEARWMSITLPFSLLPMKQ